MSNKNTFETRDVVAFYDQISDLQIAERSILAIIRDNLQRMRMLDIGVGGGRTTRHFSRLVREYVGVDYSPAMVDICRTKFVGSVPEPSFFVCDATSMEMFPDGRFDFVLFSFNGLDYMGHDDRIKALHEISRVCARKGLFCFSTHNLHSIGELYKIKTTNPLKAAYGLLIRNPLLTLMNERFGTLKRRDHAIVRDSTHWYRLRTYYVKPSEQLRQLEAVGFTDTQVYSCSGVRLEPAAFETSRDYSLYYLCRRV
jgi:ubiquinone/menaquinone biosynthesis C-methylase UbiE